MVSKGFGVGPHPACNAVLTHEFERPILSGKASFIVKVNSAGKRFSGNRERAFRSFKIIFWIFVRDVDKVEVLANEKGAL